VPDATFRNWNSYSKKVSFEKGVNVMEAFSVLPDPQTNGGLLISVAADSVDEVKNILAAEGLSDFVIPIGRCIEKEEKIIKVVL
ncbi:MAG: selenide, water dikinase SelD, partial [Chitinophagaceae bacterium]